MTLKEKYLYHQIHPLKLLADVGAGFGSLYPLWRHELALALAVMLIPPPIASFLVMRYADLEPVKQSAFGYYVSRYMTHAIEAARLLGMIVMAYGAWSRSFPIITVGLLIILLAWMWGLLKQAFSRTGSTR